MSNLGEAAASSVRGSFSLFVGNSIALVLNAIGMVLVARLLSASDYGLYSLSLVLPWLFLLFSDWGVNAALTRFIAMYKSKGEDEGWVKLERAGFIFKSVVGCLLSITLYLFSDVLASVLLKRPAIGGLVKISSLLVLSQSLYNTSASIMAGLERMNHRAMLHIIQAVVKGALSPLLVYFGFGVSGAVVGHVVGYLTPAIIGSIALLSSHSSIEMLRPEREGVSENLRTMLYYGFPLFIGGLVTGLSANFRRFLLPWFVSDELIGNYSVAQRFNSLVTLVTGSIGITLFPAFSKFNINLEPEETRKAFQGSVRYASMVVLPLVCLLAAVSNPIIYTLYTAKYPQAPFFLTLIMIPSLLIGMGALSINRFLNSQADTETSMKIQMTTSIVSITLSPLLVWVSGVYGLIISTIISQLVGNSLGRRILKTKYNLILNYDHTKRTMISCLLSGGLAFFLQQYIAQQSPVLSLLLGSTVFVLIYLLVAPLTGAIEEKDISTLDEMLNEIQIIYPLTQIILKLEDRIIRLAKRASL